MIVQAVERWIVEYIKLKDCQGRALFASNTEMIANEQTENVQWLQDPANNVEMYRKTPANKRLTH